MLWHLSKRRLFAFALVLVLTIGCYILAHLADDSSAKFTAAFSGTVALVVTGVTKPPKQHHTTQRATVSSGQLRRYEIQRKRYLQIRKGFDEQ